MRILRKVSLVLVSLASLVSLFSLVMLFENPTQFAAADVSIDGHCLRASHIAQSITCCTFKSITHVFSIDRHPGGTGSIAYQCPEQKKIKKQKIAHLPSVRLNSSAFSQMYWQHFSTLCESVRLLQYLLT